MPILTSVFLQNNTDLFRMFIARIKPLLNQSPFPRNKGEADTED